MVPLNALISVSRKKENPFLVPFATELLTLNFTLYGSGGTARYLNENNIPSIDVATLIGTNSFGDHRTVTIGLFDVLIRQDTPENRTQIKDMGFPFFDLVCFEYYHTTHELILKNAPFEQINEQTDTGAPANAAAAAKGRRIVLANVEDWFPAIDWIKAGMPTKEAYIDYLVYQVHLANQKYYAPIIDYYRQRYQNSHIDQSFMK